ncbi:MAG TPA: hypothetical protein VMA36_06130 [Candidatus Limnocylindria bacterium]|nr:hypothetical protein [Candidatus Limnocylindria bacterium]
MRLRDIDDGTTTTFPVRADGRFGRVGITPGRYLVSVLPMGPAIAGGSGQRGPQEIAPIASRLARVESDDVLDVRLGVSSVPSHPWLRGVSLAPEPVCDSDVVPPAPPTSDRFVIR